MELGRALLGSWSETSVCGGNGCLRIVSGTCGNGRGDGGMARDGREVSVADVSSNQGLASGPDRVETGYGPSWTSFDGGDQVNGSGPYVACSRRGSLGRRVHGCGSVEMACRQARDAPWLHDSEGSDPPPRLPDAKTRINGVLGVLGCDLANGNGRVRRALVSNSDGGLCCWGCDRAPEEGILVDLRISLLCQTEPVLRDHHFLRRLSWQHVGGDEALADASWRRFASTPVRVLVPFG